MTRISSRNCRRAGDGWPGSAFLRAWNVLVVLVLLAGILAGCSSATVSVAPAARPRLFSFHGHISQKAIRSIQATLFDIAQGYSSSDWNRVARQFLSPSLGHSYGTMLRTWKEDSGGDLRVDLIASRPLSKARYVGTVRFSGDARAVTTYGIFVFLQARSRTRIVSTASGLRGSTFRDANWSVSRTKHFVVYHSPYQLVGVDRRGLQDLETQRAIFARKFGVRLPLVTHYYLYPEQRLIARLTDGVCGTNPDNVGCTLQGARPPTIHSSEWVSFHEPIHVYQTVMEPHGYTAPLLIAEGMAVALEDRTVDPHLSDYCSEISYVPLDECAAYAINSVKPMSLLSDDGFRMADPGYAYSLGGSFVKYLILRYGYRPFGKFYYTLAAQPRDRVSDYEVATHRIFHTSIEHLLAAWAHTLCRGNCG